MRQLRSLVAGRLLILAALVLGLSLFAVGQGAKVGETAFAYEFSAGERALADNPTLSPSNSVPQWQRDAAQARQQSQENDRLHQSIPQFDPQAYNPPASWNYFDTQANQTRVCRRGVNGAVFCQ